MTATVAGAMMIVEEVTVTDVTTIAVIITDQVAADMMIETAATETLTVLVGLATLMKVAAGETIMINTTSMTSMPTMIMISEVPDEAGTPHPLLVLLLPPPPKYLGISFSLFSVAKIPPVNQTHCANPKKDKT